MTESDPTLDILKECGAMAVAVYHIARANDAAGIPSTYAVLAAQVERNPTHVMRVCKRLEAAGFAEVVRSDGKSVASVVRPRDPGVTLGVILGVTKTSGCDENITPAGVTLGVTFPPTPPVVVNPIQEVTLKPKRTTPQTPRAEPAYSAEYLAFWSAYPKGHGSKLKAWNEWTRLRPDAALRDEIGSGLTAWKESDRWRRGYIKDAERFLSSRMWESGPEEDAPRENQPPWQQNGNSNRAPSSGGTVQRGDPRYANDGHLSVKGRNP